MQPAVNAFAAYTLVLALMLTTPNLRAAVREVLPARTLYRSAAILIVWLLFLTTFFILNASADLNNYWPVTSDDAWIISASYKWATEGVFGSDLYAGFFNADRHYFIALPGQHVLQALVFLVVGPGIAHARWIAIASGIILVWTATWLAWRWYGLTVAFLCGLLLLFWHSNLIATNSIPLLHVSRTARYDLTAVTFTWLSALLAYLWLRKRAPAWGFGAGFMAGAASLTQFFGIAAPLNLLLLWLWSRRDASSLPSVLWPALGIALPVIPYFSYALRHWGNAVGQTQYIKASRVTLTPTVLLENFAGEWQRFRHLPQSGAGLGPWLLLLGAVPAVLYLAWRLRQHDHPGDRLLATTTMSIFLVLAVVDVTKATLYAIALLPGLCLLLSLLAGAVLQYALGRRSIFFRWALIATVASLLLLMTVQGINAHQQERRWMRNVTPYDAVGDAIQQQLPAGARVSGAERWWWALREHPYLALDTLWLQWQVAHKNESAAFTFADLINETDVHYLLISPNVRGDMQRRPERFQQEFWSFLNACTTQRGVWESLTYGNVALHEVQKNCNAP